MKQIDILFLLIDKPHMEKWRELPLGLAHLAGQVKANGMLYKILDLYNYGINVKTKKVLRTYIKLYKPRIIGISSSAYNLDLVRKEIVRIRKISKSYGLTIPIILGGYICLINNPLKITGADVLCYGEGELTLIELLNYYLKKENALELPSIKGIMFKSNGGGYIKTHSRGLITNLDSLAFPDYDSFNADHYKLHKTLPIYAQRGCFNNCQFCDIVEFYGKKYIRRISPERLIELIKTMKFKFDFKELDFMDDNFLNSSKFISKLFNLLEKHFLKNRKPEIMLSFQARADDILRMKEQLLKYKIFFSSIQIGVESLVQSQLDRWNKNIKVAQNIEANEFLSQNEIHYVNYFLWIDRETTIEELEENVKNLLNLPNVPVQLDQNSEGYVEIPNYIYHEDISAIYNNKGESTVKDIPFLHAARMFLKRTEDIIDTISATYLEFENLLISNPKEEIIYNSREFFQVAEIIAKKRFVKMLEIARQIKSLSGRNKQRFRIIIKKATKDYISKATFLIKPFLKSLQNKKQII